MANLLILGGTREALQLAQETVKIPRLRVITSLAGRTSQPAAIAGEVRSGGFGGRQGLLDYLRSNAINAVVDATHPFASEISRHAISACQQIGLPYLRWLRPAWQEQAGDRWHCVEDIASATKLLSTLGKRAFLACGRKDIELFADNRGLFFLVRLIEPLQKPLTLYDYELILARGPFTTTQEIALLKRYQIDVIVSKNSGGLASYSKISAARDLAIPVIMIQRPIMPECESVTELAATLQWIVDKLGE